MTRMEELIGSVSTLLANENSDVRTQVVVAVATKLNEGSCAGFQRLSEDDRRRALLALAQQAGGRFALGQHWSIAACKFTSTGILRVVWSKSPTVVGRPNRGGQ